MILNEVAFHFVLPPPQIFHHFNDLNPADDRVCAGNGRDDVSSHVFDFVEGLLLDAEAGHSEVGSCTDEVYDIVIVFLEDNCS